VLILIFTNFSNSDKGELKPLRIKYCKNETQFCMCTSSNGMKWKVGALLSETPASHILKVQCASTASVQYGKTQVKSCHG
jgi:hypothetical protein